MQKSEFQNYVFKGGGAYDPVLKIGPFSFTYHILSESKT